MNDGSMPDLADPIGRNMDPFDRLAEMSTANLPTLANQGVTMIQTQGREVTARVVPVPRQLATVKRKLAVYCASFGDTYVYSWEVENRREKRRQTIEGGTIKLANDLVQLYGNCATDCDVIDTPTHWLFKAWFIDYENGVSTPRLFQQRKNQDTGMRDADRRADMVFQIGQSKAIRNAVLNALSSLANYAIEESKRALIEQFSDKGNADKAWEFIERVMAEYEIELPRIEAVVGRKETAWTVRDLARVYMEMRGIFEGMTLATDVYPLPGASATHPPTTAPTAPPTQEPAAEPKKGAGGRKRKAETAATQPEAPPPASPPAAPPPPPPPPPPPSAAALFGDNG